MATKHDYTGQPFTFQPSPQGEPIIQVDLGLLRTDETISAREGYSLQETQFLKYLASKGHTGGTA